MFEYIKGKVVDLYADKIIIEVGGIGYRLYSTMYSTSNLKIGDVTTIYTHFVIKEDEMSLYGFSCRDELLLFQKLITVSKVGPKLALSILSTYTPYELSNYIVNNDSNSISKASGIGKKTAERIIVELRDKVEQYAFIKADNGYQGESHSNYEALDALIALGYNRQEAENALSTINTNNLSTEDVLKKALKLLMK